ncbi:MAG: hypothetical protein EBT36_11650, partial [Betaproteobacteria bacterium]|nr:hypothetical protein [Betaproteobacteria bacterium]
MILGIEAEPLPSTSAPIGAENSRMPPMTMSHDSLNKLLYSFSPVVRDLVLGFTKDKWLHGLDF